MLNVNTRGGFRNDGFAPVKVVDAQFVIVAEALREGMPQFRIEGSKHLEVAGIITAERAASPFFAAMLLATCPLLRQAHRPLPFSLCLLQDKSP